MKKEKTIEDYCIEDIIMLEEENKNFARALKNLGYTKDQISDIATGAI